MGKRNLNRLFTGMILAGVLGISCPEMEQLAIITAQAETNAQEGATLFGQKYSNYRSTYSLL